MISTSASRGLSRSATGAALLWLLGLYVLPFFHNIDHRPDHTHGHEPYHPPDDLHRSDHDHDHGHGSDGDHVPIDSDHGTRSILHFASAAVDGNRLPTLEASALMGVVPTPIPRHAPSRPKTLVFVRGPPIGA